jgi:hypothetical protein
MMQRLQSFLRLGRPAAPGQTTVFDGELLDQNREAVYAQLHQLGLIR